jgi:hypothetical protein
MHDHWEGRQLKQTTCKHRVAAVALAAGGTLALAGGTAFASTGGWNHNGSDPGKDPSSRDFGHKNDGEKIKQRGHSGASGFAEVTQHSGVFNLSLGASNSGLNHAGNSIDQSNGTGQSCSANTKGGNVLAIGGLGGRHDREASDANDGTSVQAGNQGGDCSNDASSANTANPTVALTTGDASATNDTSTTVNQTNSCGVDVSSSNDGSIDPSGHGDRIRQSGGSWADGELSVDQSSKVGNVSIGIANSGGNSAGNHISQSNDTGQDGSANTKGGNVLAIGGHGGADV